MSNKFEAEKQEVKAWYYQIDQSKYISFSPDGDSSKPWQPLYDHPHQKREPVAWDNCRAEKQCRIWCGNSDCVSHYTHLQPKRKPLTDEQIKQILDDCDNGEEDAEYALSFARAIEAAHGIKEKNT